MGAVGSGQWDAPCSTLGISGHVEVRVYWRPEAIWMRLTNSFERCTGSTLRPRAMLSHRPMEADATLPEEWEILLMWLSKNERIQAEIR